MMRVVTIVAVVLLAQALNPGQSRRTPPPPPSGAHLERHIDAHVAPRDGTLSARPGERSAREAPPEPAAGTVAPPDVSPPANQLYRDRFYRDRR